MKRDEETLDPRESRRKTASAGNDVVVLEVLFHPDLSRIGDRAVLGTAIDPALACALSIGRDQPLFADATGSASGLADPCVSRHQLLLRWVPALASFAIEAPASARRVVRAFSPLGEDLGTAPLDAPTGAWLTIGDRIALRLSVEPAGLGHLATGIVGSSRALADLRESCAAFARLDQAVLVSGPVGAGKERAARAIHLLGSRAAAPFVALNCAALSHMLPVRRLGFDELAPRVCPTSDLDYFPARVDRVVSRKRIRLEVSLVLTQESRWPIAFSPGRIVKDHVSMLPMTHVDPESCLSRLAASGVQHANRRIVGV